GTSDPLTPVRFLRIARQRLRTIARPRELEREIDLELTFHLEQLTLEKAREGLPAEDARREALRDFGDATRLAERSREARGLTWIADVRQDAAYGLRMLHRHPGFATIASMSLALGIGASAAIAGAIAMVMLRPLPFPQA